MDYHENFELAYLQKRKKQELGWRKERTLSELLAFPLRTPLTELLCRFSLLHPSTRILELGCGTGPISLYYCQQGLECWGVDIAPTAIDMAQELARGLTSPVRRPCFVQGSVAPLAPSLKGFDVLVDEGCLHCLIFDAERKLALTSWREALKESGFLLLHSKIQSTQSYRSPLVVDSQGVLWLRTRARHLSGGLLVGEERWLPQRRLLTGEKLVQELEEAQFDVISMEVQGEWASVIGQPRTTKTWV